MRRGVSLPFLTPKFPACAYFPNHSLFSFPFLLPFHILLEASLAVSSTSTGTTFLALSLPSTSASFSLTSPSQFFCPQLPSEARQVPSPSALAAFSPSFLAFQISSGSLHRLCRPRLLSLWTSSILLMEILGTRLYTLWLDSKR